MCDDDCEYTDSEKYSSGALYKFYGYEQVDEVNKFVSLVNYNQLFLGSFTNLCP